MTDRLPFYLWTREAIAQLIERRYGITLSVWTIGRYLKDFSSNVFIEFLRRLLRQVDGKLFLIVDGHPAHRSQEVKQWIAKKKQCIQLFYLPGYSPELNPDEVLNKGVKSNEVRRKRPKSQIEMISSVRRSRQKQPEKVKCYFREKHVQYTAF